MPDTSESTNEQKRVFLELALVLYSGSVALVRFDTFFRFRWVAFALWFASIFCVIASFGGKKEPSVQQTELRWLMPGVVLLATCVSFLYLHVYPYISMGDQLRDSGSDAQLIATGRVTEIFDWGRYYSHGMILPTINSFFYLIFGESDLTFKVPSALVGIASVALLFFVVRRELGPSYATLSSLFLLSNPLHLFYSRSQTVVIFSGLWTIVILWMITSWLRSPSSSTAARLWLALGFACGLHASVRTVAFCAAGIWAVTLVYFVIKGRMNPVGSFVATFAALTTGLIGFGPRILYWSPQIFFKTERIRPVVSGADPAQVGDLAGTLAAAYFKSLLVYFYQPAVGHFRASAPIVPYALGAFFVVGLLGLALLYRNRLVWIVAALGFVLPLTNSAMLVSQNANHRLAPLFPLASIVCAVGVVSVLQIRLRNPFGWLKNGLFIVCLTVLMVREVYNFFRNERANMSMFTSAQNPPWRQFMIQDAAYAARDNAIFHDTTTICFTASLTLAPYLALYHVREVLLFFIFPRTLMLNSVAAPLGISRSGVIVDDRSLFISRRCPPDISLVTWEKLERCKQYRKFVCPPDRGSFTLYVEKPSGTEPEYRSVIGQMLGHYPYKK